MTVSELAKTFGIKVKQLSEITGYTRQGLDNLMKHGKKTLRSKALVNALYTYTELQYQKDVEKAEQTKIDRMLAIENLEKMLDENDGR